MFLFIQGVKATTFYIDSDSGNNENSGNTEDCAWVDFENLNHIGLSPGDSLLLKRGSVFYRPLALEIKGEYESLIYVGAYGDNGLPKPIINGGGNKRYGLLIKNSSNCIISDLAISNTGIKREAHRVGVYILAEDVGECRNITVQNLEVNNVNGSLVKNKGAGGAMFWENKGSNIKSRFVGLTITGCHIRNCGRNGIYSDGYASRNNWYPNLKVVISHNLIEGVPGDGIVPIGCDGAIIEYNVMRNCPDILSADEAAAGIWPWSCDNTVIQYNEVSGHNAKWDGQGFDADYNCTNTLIQYNYSHDNAGGFLLVCNDGNSLGKSWNRGTLNSTIRYNISVNDGIRKYPTKQAGWFAPVIHITGPVENTHIHNNLVVQLPKAGDTLDYRLLKMGNWGNKWPNNTVIKDNLFVANGNIKPELDLGKDTHTLIEGNYYSGSFLDFTDANIKTEINNSDIDQVLEAEGVPNKIAELKKLFKEINHLAR